LALPKELKEGLLPLAKELKGSSLEETLKRIRDFFAQNFTYTLEPGPPQGEPVLYFLTQSKAGFCEHFASAAALLLRTMGYSARVVTGFSLGKHRSWKKSYPILASSAHAWVEVWDGSNWRVFDPTPVSWPLSLRFWVWVSDVEETAHDLLVSPLFPSAIFLVTLFFLGRRLLFPRKLGPGEEFLAFWSALGHRKRPGETMAEFVTRLIELYPSLDQELIDFLKSYHEVVFGERGSPETLRSALKKIKSRVIREARKTKRGPFSG
jgi:hypothetical protein